MKLRLYYIGKPRDAAAGELTREFLKRAGRWVECESREIDPRRFDLPARHAAAYKVFLDPAGKTLDSAAFARLLGKLRDEGRGETVFLVGGHDGLPPAWRDKADLLLSLSAMTFPHEMARAMLAEQIYRALATLNGHPYPR